ncbi:3-isopropylmalate dehydratase large subunit [Alishewanella longhuensis]
MSTGKVLSGAGLRGQVAGKTALSTVGKTGSGLTYRGYDVKDLAANCTFEEVAHLILKGELPNSAELAAYKAKLKSLRALPQALKDVLERIPANAHPMDVMRTGCSMLGNLEMEDSFAQQQDVTDRMLAIFPGLVNYWYNYSHHGKRVNVETDADTLAEQFLWTLHDKKPEALHIDVMQASLILYAEHEFNASTFTARVCASTLSDMHSCITGVELTGKAQPGIMATDCAALTEFLRKEKVVSSYLEFFGEGADSLSLGDRATISNMTPEYGATAAMFSIDQQTLDYLTLTGREVRRLNWLKLMPKPLACGARA